MSCSHPAACRRSASAPRKGVRLRARAATPWTCAQRRGSGTCKSARARSSAQQASGFIRPRVDSRLGTFTDLACHLKTSREASILAIGYCMVAPPRRSWLQQESCAVSTALQRSSEDPRPQPGGLTSPYMGRFLARFQAGFFELATDGLAALGSGGLSRLLGWKRGSTHDRTNAFPPY